MVKTMETIQDMNGNEIPKYCSHNTNKFHHWKLNDDKKSFYCHYCKEERDPIWGGEIYYYELDKFEREMKQ